MRISGDSLLGLCPFHHERNPSFSVDLKTGKWNCFTEGESGNFVTFYAKLHGVDTKTAYKEILEKYGVSREEPKREAKTGGLVPYSLEQYSRDKQLPVDFLRDGEFTGTVYRWDCARLDAKDPSDVYFSHGREDGGRLIRKWFDNRTSRFVEFYIGKIAESKDPVEAAEDEMDESEPTEAEVAAQEKTGGFTEMEDGDGSDPLPF